MASSIRRHSGERSFRPVRGSGDSRASPYPGLTAGATLFGRSAAGGGPIARRGHHVVILSVAKDLAVVVSVGVVWRSAVGLRTHRASSGWRGGCGDPHASAGEALTPNTEDDSLPKDLYWQRYPGANVYLERR